MLKIPYLKLFATDKEELLDQVRSYAFSKGAVAGTEDDEEEVWAQIGRSADVLVISEAESGDKTFTVTSNTIFDRSVLTEYKGQDKTGDVTRQGTRHGTRDKTRDKTKQYPLIPNEH